MVQFVQNYWLSILLALCVLGVLIIMWKRGKKDTVKSIVYALVCQAEQAFGSKTGQAKYGMVWTGIYGKLPWIIRVLYTQKELEQFINEGLQLLKYQLKNGKMNLLTYNQEVESILLKKVTLPETEKKCEEAPG